MAKFNLKGGVATDYVLGRGKVYLKEEFSSAGAISGWRDIGNATAFTYTEETEKKEHQSYLTGLKTVDLEVALSTKATISFTIDETQNLLNLSPAFFGEGLGYGHPDNPGLLTPVGSTPGVPNAAAINSSDTAAWVGNGPVSASTKNFVLAAGTYTYDLWYDISMNFTSGVGPTDLGTWRAYNYDSSQTITVKKNCTSRDETTGTALVEGVDYELDKKMGRIRFLSRTSPTLTPATELALIHWTKPAVDRHITGTLQGFDVYLGIIKPLTNSGKTVAVKFVLENPNDGDRQMEYEFYRVKLTPDGEIALIGDDWAGLSFTGALSSIENPPPGGSAYGRITLPTI